ncbi:hypothetical protein [Pseudomonas sp. Y24-6]|uniref:hypothetical protein n=1 Tax=Pseudomonas sp. Y24-6 TaxID=2750013 RepID=UPI001CE111CD|nr:hypothetical protein [Pseudomonas sp. Y24-6]MCA4962034.1 phenylacetate--CoA ligase family protein [Pseudomonas sp. Y24-6]
MKDFYNKLPAIIQDVAVSLAGLKQKRVRYDSYFRQVFSAQLEREKWSEDQSLAFQNLQISHALERAASTPYYSKLFESIGAHWSELCDDKNFKKIPITYKGSVSENPEAFKTRSTFKSDKIISTSGTTGKSLVFPASKKFDSEQWAVWWRYRARFGIEQWTKCALFSSTPIVPSHETQRFYRANHAYNEYRFSVFHISEKTVSSYVESLNKIKAPWIHGNPSALSLLAKLMLDHNLKLGHTVRWLTIGSENLQDWQEKVLIQVFGTKPIQHYGLMEGVANISQCPNGNLHTDEDFSFVEYIKQEESDNCLIVGTSFCNDAFSLIRYSTGDIATPKEGRCACGRPGRLVSSIDGRFTDYITLAGGERVASLAGPFHSTPGLSEAQIYQDHAGALTIRYVPSIDWDNRNLISLEKKLRDRIGNSLPIRFQIVDKVERTPRGKAKLVISDFTPE